MTFAQVMNDLTICGVFVFIGYVLRETVPFLRKLYLPASVIGGILVLVLGPQVLGLIEVPESFASYATPLTNIVFTALVWGVSINSKKLKSYLDFTLIEFTVTWWQVALGSIVGIACVRLWSSMPQGWGLMAPFSFLSGHGTAASMAAVFDGYGITGTGDIGMILSTVGLMSAMVIGTIFVNIGIRKHATVFVNPDTDIEKSKAGILPQNRQVPIGTTKVDNAAVNNLLFQFSIVLTVLWFGTGIMKFLSQYSSLIAKLPATMYGIIGCLILWPVAKKAKLDKYVDKPTVNTISGMTIDVLIVGAVGTINLQFVSQFWLPMVIISAVCVGFTAAFTFFMCYKCCGVEWFEKAVFIYGMSTGIVATGFALHRMVDPNTTSTVPEAQGVASGITSPITFPLYTFFVMLAATKPGMEVLVGGIMAVGLSIVTWMLFRRKVKMEFGR